MLMAAPTATPCAAAGSGAGPVASSDSQVAGQSKAGTAGSGSSASAPCGALTASDATSISWMNGGDLGRGIGTPGVIDPAREFAQHWIAGELDPRLEGF
jgi:hypothetical protein